MSFPIYEYSPFISLAGLYQVCSEGRGQTVHINQNRNGTHRQGHLAEFTEFCTSPRNVFVARFKLLHEACIML